MDENACYLYRRSLWRSILERARTHGFTDTGYGPAFETAMLMRGEGLLTYQGPRTLVPTAAGLAWLGEAVTCTHGIPETHACRDCWQKATPWDDLDNARLEDCGRDLLELGRDYDTAVNQGSYGLRARRVDGKIEVSWDSWSEALTVKACERTFSDACHELRQKLAARIKEGGAW